MRATVIAGEARRRPYETPIAARVARASWSPSTLNLHCFELSPTALSGSWEDRRLSPTLFHASDYWTMNREIIVYSYEVIRVRVALGDDALFCGAHRRTF